MRLSRCVLAFAAIHAAFAQAAHNNITANAPRLTTRPCNTSTDGSVQLTPLVMKVEHDPIPFKGGDGSYHLVYELTL
jgi:hypothetical protein